MRLATVLLRLPLAIVGEIVDRIFGPDELKGRTWPDTTHVTEVDDGDGLGYEIVHGSGW